MESATLRIEVVVVEVSGKILEKTEECEVRKKMKKKKE
jgi:hypothetical protein